MNQPKLLIVDDDPKIIKFLSNFLTREGYEVHTAQSGKAALEEYQKITPDLILLDVMMPEMDGFEVCRRIREESKVPVIFLSAKSATIDRIVGLTLGSDDYLTKPFDSAELSLRVRAVLRRSSANKSSEEGEVIKVPGLVINKSSMIVEVNGEETELTPKEFDLLWLLASRPTQVFTREQLIYQVWGTEYAEDTGIVTTLVKRLREKIEPDSASPRYIKTIRGVGYKFGIKPLSCH